MDLGWIWGVSGGYLGGIPALVRTSSVDLEVSGVDLGSIWPSCALPPSAKIYRKSIENLSKIYRKSIENLSNIYRTSIENLSKIYRKSIEHPSKIYRKSIENLWVEVRTKARSTPAPPQIPQDPLQRCALRPRYPPDTSQILPRSTPNL